jgi:hypothetical protein
MFFPDDFVPVTAILASFHLLLPNTAARAAVELGIVGR